MLAFAHPWILVALAGIPALWWVALPRPPAWRRVDFPPARFLEGLENKAVSARAGALWRFLLRAAIVGCVIVGLAGPGLAPEEKSPAPSEVYGPPAPPPRPVVAIVAQDGWKNQPALTRPDHYIRAALADTAELTTWKEKNSARPDLVIATRSVEAQGWVLLFLGPGATKGLRLSDSAIAASQTLGLGYFAPDSPLKNLNNDPDLHLPAVEQGAQGAVWAVLADGTPLITVQNQVVTVHARVQDLATSSLFPQLLRRVVAHATPGPEAAALAPEGKPQTPENKGSIGPWLLAAALALLLFDGAIPAVRRQAILVALCLVLCGAPALAADPPLAYVRADAPGLDHVAHAGLTRLAATLKQRTTAAPGGVRPLDPTDPALPAHTFVYWPVAPDAKPLTPIEKLSVQSLLDHGGIIVFDTAQASVEAAARLTQGLVLPPLEPAGDGHLLARSFYRIEGLAERGIWVEPAAGRPARVIVLTGDLARRWAEGDEAALRLGVNIAIYAMTGTYKGEQPRPAPEE